MQGQYNIYLNDKIVYQKNIITSAGRLGALNAIAGKRNSFIESIVVGIGDTVATENDSDLVFEVGGANVGTVIVDPVNEKIYFKSVLPIGDQYEVHELGCYPTSITTAQNINTQASSLLLNFNSQTRWFDTQGTSTRETTNNRLDVDSIQYSMSASQTVKGYAGVNLDLSLLAENTEFSLAYYSNNLSDLIIRFKNDDSNYYSYDGLTISNGYNISQFLKSNFVSTGTPSWSSINSIAIEATATASPGTISLDGLRYSLSNGIENNLLTRAVLDTPIVKLAGITMDVEYVLSLDL